MRIEYDGVTDMAYLTFVEIKRGGVYSTIPCVGRSHRLNLDFDAGQQLVGIEVFDAKRTLPAAVLEPPDQSPSDEMFQKWYATLQSEGSLSPTSQWLLLGMVMGQRSRIETLQRSAAPV